jgi:hypothetical protein
MLSVVVVIAAVTPLVLVVFDLVLNERRRATRAAPANPGPVPGDPVVAPVDQAGAPVDQAGWRLMTFGSPT